MKGNIAKSDRNMKREKSTKAGPFYAWQIGERLSCFYKI